MVWVQMNRFYVGGFDIYVINFVCIKFGDWEIYFS